MGNENIKELISYLLGIIGTLLLLGGGLAAYIFTRHVGENDCDRDQNREDHKEIYSILRDKVDRS